MERCVIGRAPAFRSRSCGCRADFLVTGGAPRRRQGGRRRAAPQAAALSRSGGDARPFRNCLWTDNEIGRSLATASRAEAAPRGVAIGSLLRGASKSISLGRPFFFRLAAIPARETRTAAGTGQQIAIPQRPANKPVHSLSEPERAALAVAAVGNEARRRRRWLRSSRG
jgi:hypothetical protein